jgi:taurine dioxygenase
MFSPAPAMGTILYALEVPSAGGDTMFTNQYLAYESLSDGMKALCSQLSTVCVGDNFKQHGGQSRAQRYDRQMTHMKVKDPGNVQTTSVHPLVRTHPETGRKALYTSDAHTAHIQGWTEKESLPLLRFLWEHQTRPEFTCRFRWDVGSLAFWDNRCAMHNPINDYHGYRRVMHRVTLAGDKPR